ncbi:MAG: hypothetical protein IJI41_12825 [Anaerolineaceae bacterium]|nr:hypothetical protein [Anaerolineaceae bacterium]
MKRTNISEYSDVLVVQDLMDYLRIGKNAALQLFREPDFESLEIGTRKKMITKTNLLKYLNEHAKTVQRSNI